MPIKLVMKTIWMIAILIFLSACTKPYNSSYSDKMKYGANLTGSSAFFSARDVMISRCFTCHSEWALLNEDEFESTGLVTGGDPNVSPLYIKISGNDSGIQGDMPPSDSLSADEIQRIKSWIIGM